MSSKKRRNGGPSRPDVDCVQVALTSRDSQEMRRVAHTDPAAIKPLAVTPHAPAPKRRTTPGFAENEGMVVIQPPQSPRPKYIADAQTLLVKPAPKPRKPGQGR